MNHSTIDKINALAELGEKVVTASYIAASALAIIYIISYIRGK